MYSTKNQILHNDIVIVAREIYAKRYHDVEPHKGCLYWAAAFIEAARIFGRDDVLIQAGSAQFQFRADSDGKRNTHFSYMFVKDEAIYRMKHGLLPEIHMWNALRDTQEIVDLTTRYQAKQAKNLQGFDWQPEFALPDYFWGRPDGDRMIYVPDMAATFYALGKLEDLVSPAIPNKNVA